MHPDRLATADLLDWLFLVMCQEYSDPNVKRHEVRNALTEELAKQGAPDGIPDADEETWGTTPEEVAAQEAMMRRAGMVGTDDSEDTDVPDYGTPPAPGETPTAPGGDH